MVLCQELTVVTCFAKGRSLAVILFNTLLDGMVLTVIDYNSLDLFAILQQNFCPPVDNSAHELISKNNQLHDDFD